MLTRIHSLRKRFHVTSPQIQGVNRIVAIAAQPAPVADARPIQSYYSLQVLVEIINFNGGQNNALQITFADAKSLRMGQAP